MALRAPKKAVEVVRRARKRSVKSNTRFASWVLLVIGITTLLFIAAQYFSFLHTGVEQTVLIEQYFTAIVIECGALMLKRITEVAVARIKKKENLNTNEESEE